MSSSRPSPEAWRECYERLAPKLLLYARQWLPSGADAEDAVQAGFIRFWRKQPNAHSSDYPLLFAAVRSAALDLLRRDDRRSRREDAFHRDQYDSPVILFDTDLERKEDAQMVEGALRQLSPEQREVLVLRIWGELTFAEIATTLGDSINTVASRYRYGLEALRKILTPHVHESV